MSRMRSSRQRSIMTKSWSRPSSDVSFGTLDRSMWRLHQIAAMSGPRVGAWVHVFCPYAFSIFCWFLQFLDFKHTKKTSTHHQNQKSKNKTQNNQKLFEESRGPWGCAALSFCFLFFFSGCVFWKYFLQTHPPNSSYRVFPEFIVQKAPLYIHCIQLVAPMILYVNWKLFSSLAHVCHQTYVGLPFGCQVKK